MTITKVEKIQLDEYKELKNAERLDEIANGLFQDIKGLEQSKNQLSKKWKGYAVSEYISKMNRVEQEILMHSREIKEAAVLLRSVAARTKEAEEKAIDIAQQRSYKQ